MVFVRPCLLALLAAGALLSCACDRGKPATPPAPRAEVPSPGDPAGGAAEPGAARATGSSAAPDARKTAPDANAEEGATSDAAAIGRLLAQVTNAAFSRGGLDDLASRFASPARERLQSEIDTVGGEDLDARISLFLRAWQAKYGEPPRVKDAAAVFTPDFFQFAPGAAPAGPGDSLSANLDARAVTVDGGGAAADRGTVTVPPEGALPALRVRVVREATWKLDGPPALTAATLKGSVLEALNRLEASQAAWPADVTEARRMLTHQLLWGIEEVR